MTRKRSILALALPVMLLGAAFPTPQSWPNVNVRRHTATMLGPGVTYDAWQLATATGPLAVYVTTVDLHDPHVGLGVVTHGDAIVGSDEPLSSMADRVHAEAAINADYFDINGSGAPLNAVISSGRVLHQPDEAAVFATGPGNAVTMGPLSMRVTLSDRSGAELAINDVNDWSLNDGLSLLTTEFGAPASADLAVVLAPDPTSAGAYRVTSVQQGATLAPPPAGDLAIVARGAEQVGRLSAFGLNDAVTLRFDGSPPPSSIVNAVGGGPLLLSDGKLVTDPAAPAPQEAGVRYPVTGAGVSADGSTLWLVAVDGRSPARSVGITRPMLASLFAALGASQAMAFDSGGSTEMAIRYPGDTGVTVANVPSDGKERSIADCLVVLNTATPGPAATLEVRAPTTVAMQGSHLTLTGAAVDANLQPAQLQPGSIRFVSDVPAVATVDDDGRIDAVRPGRARIIAEASAQPAHQGIAGATVRSAPLDVTVVRSPDAIAIEGYDRVVETNEPARLSVAATMRDGSAVAVDPGAVSWSAQGDGRIGADGVFTAGGAPGIALVDARAGSATARLELLVGEHAVAIDPLAGSPLQAPAWRFSASSAAAIGSVDDAPAPDGARALHLDYAFSPGGTRAAYAEREVPISGQPLAIAVDVYGDANGEWLRAGYRNADGIDDSLTLARHVDWTGWRTLRVAIPAQARWPIVWTKFYAVETRSDSAEAGDLWFRAFNGVYAGPVSGATPAPSPSPAGSRARPHARFPSPESRSSSR